MRRVRIINQRNFEPLDNAAPKLCLKSKDRTWIGSVQGAVATWSVIGMRYFRRILTPMVTRSLSLPVLTRSKNDFGLLRQSLAPIDSL